MSLTTHSNQPTTTPTHNPPTTDNTQTTDNTPTTDNTQTTNNTQTTSAAKNNSQYLELLLPLTQTIGCFKRFPVNLCFHDDALEAEYLVWWFSNHRVWLIPVLSVLYAFKLLYIVLLWVLNADNVYNLSMYTLLACIILIVLGLFFLYMRITKDKPQPFYFGIACGFIVLVAVSVETIGPFINYDPTSPPVAPVLYTLGSGILFFYRAHFTATVLLVTPFIYLLGQIIIGVQINGIFLLNLMATYSTSVLLCYNAELRHRRIFLSSPTRCQYIQSLPTQSLPKWLTAVKRIFLTNNSCVVPKNYHGITDFNRYFINEMSVQLRLALPPLLVGNFVLMYQDLSEVVPENTGIVLSLRLVGFFLTSLFLGAVALRMKLKIPLKSVPILLAVGSFCLAETNIAIPVFLPNSIYMFKTYHLVVLRNIIHAFLSIGNVVAYELIVSGLEVASFTALLIVRKEAVFYTATMAVYLVGSAVLGLITNSHKKAILFAHFKQVAEYNTNTNTTLTMTVTANFCDVNGDNNSSMTERLWL